MGPARRAPGAALGALGALAALAAGRAAELRILRGAFSAPVVLDRGLGATFRARSLVEGAEGSRTFKVLLELDLSGGGVKWLGFGVADQTSGHMLGSDIATLHFDPEDPEVGVTLFDRYVPWATYPFTASDLYPVVDEHADWCLEAYEFTGDPAEPATGFAAVVSRPMDTGDPYDNEISEDWSSLLAVWAYGNSEGDVAYHGKNRGTASLLLGPEDEVRKITDAEGTTDIIFSEYALPNTLDTYYSCQGFDLSSENKRHIVALEPLIQEANTPHVHHVVVHRCKAGKFFDDHVKPVACNPQEADDPLDMHGHGGDSPTGSSGGACEGLVYVWAAGQGLFVLPEDAGIPFGAGENSHFIVEIHYDNPEKTPGIVDSSGFRIHWTESLRKHDAATLTVGDGTVSDGTPIPARSPEDHRQYTCPEECTSRFTEDIHVFGTAPHMHYVGRTIWTTVTRAGQYYADLDRKEYWNNGFQKAIYRDKTFTIKPGDRLTTHCVFDTKRMERPVSFGSSTKNEMCMDFVFYYPRQSMGGEDTGELSYCGENVEASKNMGASLYLCGSPTAPDTETSSPWIYLQGDLGLKHESSHSGGGRTQYRFDEGEPASTQPNLCKTPEAFYPEPEPEPGPEPEPEPEQQHEGPGGAGQSNNNAGRPVPALAALLAGAAALAL